MKGITPVISIIIIILISISLIAVAWFYFFGYLGGRTAKTIITPYSPYICRSGSPRIILQNAGTDEIVVAAPPPIAISDLGNMIPNPGFEFSSDGVHPDSWGENVSGTETFDVVLVTDLSNSMSDCMDDRNETAHDADAVLIMGFDDGTAADSSFWGNNGTLNGPAYLAGGGKHGGAFHFDGSDDYVQVPHDYSLTNFDALTLEAWVNINNLSNRMVVVGKYYEEYEMMIDDYGTVLKLFKTKGASYAQAYHPFDFQTGVWYHLAITWKGNEAKFYINGDLKAIKEIVAPDTIKGTHDLEIGRRSGQSEYFNGTIDDVAVYGRVLAEEEIRSHADALLGEGCNDITPYADMVLWMKMDDNVQGAGQTITDSSGRGNDGTTQNNVDCTVPGRFGLGCSFNGIVNTQINLPNTEDLNFTTQNFSISLWYNANNTNSAPLFQKGGPAAVGGEGYAMKYSSIFLADGGGNTRGFIIPYPPKNEWVHMVYLATYNGTDWGQSRIYRDGVLGQWHNSNLANVHGSIWTHEIPRIGGYGAGWGSFNGTIDEVMVFNRTLTEEEIWHLANNCSVCPDDGKGDMPSWCRYETTLCPQACSSGDEAYCPATWPGGSFSPPDFNNISFSFSTCNMMPGCDGSACGTDIYSGYLTYDSVVMRDVTCNVGECPNGYSDCYWVARTDQSDPICDDLGYIADTGTNTDSSVCRSSCNADEADGGDCYTWRDRLTCDGPDECLPTETDIGDSSVYAWRAACLGSECTTGEIRYTQFQCTEGGSCGAGQTPCGFCGGSCAAYETCCCIDSSIEYKCEQQQDQCKSGEACEKYSDYCCNDIECLTNPQVECCDSLASCMAASITGTVGCTPGFHGVRPDSSNNCGSDSGSWMCGTEDGSCYLCDSVAIRLAKKLDKDFVNDVFNYSPSNAQMAIVSYGDTVVGESSLVGSGSKDAMISSIDSYTADKGETCISCAIAKALEKFSSSTADKRYVVLMSDGEANRCISGACSETEARNEANATACDYNNDPLNSDKQVIFFTIGFGKDAGDETLQNIANCSPAGSGKYFQGNSPEQLADIYKEIGEHIGKGKIEKTVVEYGQNAMRLSAGEVLPKAESEKFRVFVGPGGNYVFSFYRMLKLTQGSFKAVIQFYNITGSAINPPVEKVVSGNVDETGAGQLTKRVYTLIYGDGADIPTDAHEASIKFEFVGAGNTDFAILDDVYFGPEVTAGCSLTAKNMFECGDISIIKTSNDGDLYPYVSVNSVKPKETLVIVDANCHGQCNYRIVSPSNVLDISVNC